MFFSLEWALFEIERLVLEASSIETPLITSYMQQTSMCMCRGGDGNEEEANTLLVINRYRRRRGYVKEL